MAGTKITVRKNKDSKLVKSADQTFRDGTQMWQREKNYDDPTDTTPVGKKSAEKFLSTLDTAMEARAKKKKK